MRIDAISLSWFRGAADPVTISPAGKSMVIYGENGSGKSSFVDAIEFCLNNCKVGHLAHEYSGKRQERGILNTHTPAGKGAEIRIKFADRSERVTTISNSGAPKSSGADAAALTTWDYRRTILRQSEVAAFIQETKGAKYSALLPLLGLQPLETAAENLRQLRKTTEEEARLVDATTRLSEVGQKRRDLLQGATDEAIVARIEALHAQYVPGKPTPTSVSDTGLDVTEALAERISGFTAEQQRHLTFSEVATFQLEPQIAAVRSAIAALVSSAESFVSERLQILRSTGSYLEKQDTTGMVECPACGQSLPAEDFRSHIADERKRLTEASADLDTLKAARGLLCDTLLSLKRAFETDQGRSCRAMLEQHTLADGFACLATMNVEGLRTSCTEDDLGTFELVLVPLIKAAAAIQGASPDIEVIVRDRDFLDAGRGVLASQPLRGRTARAKALTSFLSALEAGVRTEIRQRSQEIVASISADVQRMWAILHPGEAIADVRLCLPDDSDKAIDIQLRFHGVAQDSPCLTLSEGHRNSLGLCIFLAMAKRDAATDRPLILDDVVVSLDRNHRGMIVELLEKEFGGRQVILLTHEREWFSELRLLLAGPQWVFNALMPYDAPEIGIRVSASKSATFDDARVHLKTSPDSAGNAARKIMDIELAVRAPRIKLRLPYLHREKNDRRMAHEFLAEIISSGARCLVVQKDGKFVPHTAAIDVVRNADRLVLAWANRASHSFDLVRSEAEQLIEACEAALRTFDCESCAKPVYQTDDMGGQFVQCRCGQLRWLYGKG